MKISIITPVKNRVSFIGECIDSLASQTFINFEHVIVDGKSQDGTCEVIENRIKDGNSNIKYLSELDSSPGEAWNKGINLATGDIIGWLGADDSLSEKIVLEFVAEFFKKNDKIDVMYGGCNFLNENNEIFGKIEEYEYSYNKLLNHSNYIPATSLFVRRAVFDNVGELDSYGNDFDYILRIAKKYNIHSVRKILSNFMLAVDSETGDFRKYTRVLKLDWEVSKKHGGRLLNNYHRRYLLFSFASLVGLSSYLNKLRNKRKGNTL